MTLSKEIQKYLDSQIEYYIDQAESYKELAREYNPDGNSISDTAFGIIIGCIYSSFIQTYANENSTPSSQDVEEFTKLIIKNSKKIKESTLDNYSKLKQE